MGNLIFRKALELEEKGEAFAIVTFVHGKGHLPQEAGAKMIVTAAGLLLGTVGGGLVEARAIREAQSMLAENRHEPLFLTWNLQRELQMTCGGEMSFLIESQLPRAWNVVVYGAGHVGNAVAKLLSSLDCLLTVIDAREEWRAKLPSGVVAHDWAKPEAHVVQLPRGAFHVVVTQDHATDIPILAAIHAFDPEAPFVGVIGSKAKAAKVRSELHALGCSAAFLEKVRCPIGLELGANVPAEIAVSIAAQLLQVRGDSL